MSGDQKVESHGHWLSVSMYFRLCPQCPAKGQDPFFYFKFIVFVLLETDTFDYESHLNNCLDTAARLGPNWTGRAESAESTKPFFLAAICCCISYLY